RLGSGRRGRHHLQRQAGHRDSAAESRSEAADSRLLEVEIAEEDSVKRFSRLVGLLLFFSTAAAARADMFVNLCAQDEQLGPGARVSLKTALSAGGNITFRCGAHATIKITSTHVIGIPTEIDGANAVILDAGDAHSVFQLPSPTAVLRLKDITVRRGRPAGPGAIAGLGRAAAPGTARLHPARLQ